MTDENTLQRFHDLNLQKKTNAALCLDGRRGVALFLSYSSHLLPVMMTEFVVTPTPTPTPTPRKVVVTMGSATRVHTSTKRGTR